MDFSAELTKTQAVINTALAHYMKTEPLPQKRVYDAMSYSLLAGGKRLRPVIMIYANQMCGGEVQDVLPFACAIEMIHTYSLIHDDLPAMDDDDLRRGRPTNHIQFDEATAILAGDALLNMAFEITADVTGSLSADRALRAVSVLAKASGAAGMIGGQMLDIQSEEKALTPPALEHLHILKTGALIRASGVCGAVVAGAGEAEIKAIDTYCLNLGLAFQIRDDILDVTGNAETLGKMTGSDLGNMKNTYVSLTSLAHSEKRVQELTEAAIQELTIFNGKADKLCRMARQLTEREF